MESNKEKNTQTGTGRILQGFGTKLDLLNPQWIYRTKRYYTVSGEAVKKASDTNLVTGCEAASWSI